MTMRVAGAMLLMASTLAGAAPPATVVPAYTVKCDVRIVVTDPDPKGLNVRAEPKVAPGNIVGVLKPDGEWTTVHAAGLSGDWFLIDEAVMVDDNAPAGERPVFKGRGWVHKSKVGGLEIEPRDVLEAPKEGAKSLMKGGDTSRTVNLKVVGCQGKFIQLQGPTVKGWASRYCTNQRTTCA
jgi:SH3-like domain-containing protein